MGGCRDDVCGLISGGALIMGALWGRISPTEDDKPLYELVCRYRQHFVDRYGSSICDPIRNILPEADKRCAPLVHEAAALLTDMIQQAADEEPFRSRGA
jgi:hypothetical protein